MIDLVIPLGSGSEWEDNELRYCLRSFEINLFDLGQIFIVGHKPSWLTNVMHFEYPDTLTRNKDGNLIAKVITACEQPLLSEKFIRLSDDQLLLKKIFSEEIHPYFVQINLPERPLSRWKQRLRKGIDILASRDLSVYNYESHLPMIIDKNRYPEIMKTFPYYEEGGGVTVNTPYFNTILTEHTLLPSSVKFTIERPCTASQILEGVKNSMFLGYNDRGLNDDLKAVIANMFPNKSKYEL